MGSITLIINHLDPKVRKQCKKKLFLFYKFYFIQDFYRKLQKNKVKKSLTKIHVIKCLIIVWLGNLQVLQCSDTKCLVPWKIKTAKLSKIINLKISKLIKNNKNKQNYLLKIKN